MNKIWNAAKFINLNFEAEGNSKEDSFFDAWICNEFNILLDNYSQHIENCEVEKASYELYHFFWDDFCDWYIEIAKTRFYSEDLEKQAMTYYVCLRCIRTILPLMHPYTTIITEELCAYFKEHEQSNFERIGEKILWSTRYIVLFSVFSSVFASIVLFLVGSYEIAETIYCLLYTSPSPRDS